MSYLNARDSNICKQLEILYVCKSKVGEKKNTQLLLKSYDLGVKHRIFFKVLCSLVLQTVNVCCIKNTLLGTISLQNL